MSRPSFQFYPADWQKDLSLRRCTLEEKGAWMEVLCVLHESDEYGILRWELKEIAEVSGVKLRILKQLSKKNVLRGSDGKFDDFIYTPRHAGKDGTPVVLIQGGDGPCWYSARFVKDEYVRLNRGVSTRFGKQSEPNNPPEPEPTRRVGERQGTGSSSSTSSSSSSKDNLKEKILKEISERAIGYLNEKAGTQFKPNNQKTLKHISARVNEGFGIEDFEVVINGRVAKWIDDPAMREYLRPETVFGTKFEGYLSEAKRSLAKPAGAKSGGFNGEVIY